MSLSAGVVYATLGGKFDPAGFVRFGTAMRTAQGQMEAGEKRMKTSAQRTSASLHAIGHAAKIGAGAGIIGLGAVIAGSIKKAADFESQLASLKAVSNATGREMGLLRKQAMEAGAATKFSALDAAQAQTELAKGGLTTAKILSGGLKGALALAAAGEMELADAAATTANALNLFKLNGSQATHVADAMAQAANSTTADVNDFAMALTQGGAAAKAAGLTFDQTMVALEALASAGVKGSDAGTSIKAAFTQLASPTTKSKDLMKDLGLEFFKANGQMKSMPQIAGMLGDKLGGLTKQQRLQAVTTLAGTDGMRTLLALYDSGKGQLQRYGTELSKTGTAAKVAAEKQDTFKGKLENLKGSIETAGIKIGTALLPMFERLATKGTAWVNELVSSGKIDQFAAGVEQAFRTLGTVLSDFWGLAHPVIDLFLDLGRAIGMTDAGTIEALALGFAAFKVVGTVIPMLQTFGGALSTAVQAAMTAPTIGALLADIGISPIGAAAVAAGGLVTALVLLGDQEGIEERLARQNAEAHRDQADAIKSVGDAERASADKGLAAKQSQLDLERAHIAVGQALKDHGRKSLEYRQAVIAERQATLRNADAQKVYREAIGTQLADNVNRVRNALSNLGTARKELTKLESDAAARAKTGANPYTDPAFQEARAKAMGNVIGRTKEYVQALARAQVSDLNRQRLMQSANQITEKNAVAISRLVSSMGKVPAKTQAKVLLEDQDALGKIGTLIGKLRGVDRERTVAKILTTADSARSQVLAFEAVVRGVPPSKVFRILHNANTAKGEMQGLKAAIDAIPTSKTTTITTRRITEFREVHGGTVKGQAAGGKTSGPQMYLVGEGSDPVEWIIPRDPKYRHRALGLLADAAKSILPGAAKGAKTGGITRGSRSWYLPGHMDPLSLPVDDFEDRLRKAQDALDKVRGVIRDTPGQLDTINASIRDITRRDPKTKAQKKNKADDLARAQKKHKDLLDALGTAKGALPKRQADRDQRQSELASARSYAGRITKQSELADIAADQMRLASDRGNQKAYDKAAGQRKTALTRWRSLLIEAQKHVPRNSPYGRALAKALGQVDIDLQDLSTAQSDASQEAAGDAKELADLEASTGMTEAERAQLEQIDQDTALAALTETLDDDKEQAQGKLTLLEQVLAEIRPGGSRPGTAAAVTSIAGAVAQARQTVKDLNAPPEKTADQEAQIAQLTAQRDIARREASANAAWAQSAGGPGDIGEGGPSARGAVVNINTLHPGDPATLRAVGDAAAAGFNYQGAKSAPRQAAGI